MNNSKDYDRKSKPGPPASGITPQVGIRMTQEFQDEIKAWAKKQNDNPSLAAAIRRLVDIGLASGPVMPNVAIKPAQRSAIFSGHQLKAARALIGANQAEIAAAAGVARHTINRMEKLGAKPIASNDRTLAAVLAALEARGVMLVPEGVVLASQKPAPAP
jgi:DNA-binding XRE family transcriptional regulator